MLSRVPRSFYINRYRKATLTMAKRKTEPTQKPDYKLMKRLLNELVNNATLKVSEMAAIVECVIEIRVELLKEHEPKTPEPDREPERDDVTVFYPQASTPESSVDYPDETMSISSVSSNASSLNSIEESVRSPYLDLINDYADPAKTENRKLTEAEIEALNSDIQLIIEQPRGSYKFLLLNLLIKENSRFQDCVPEKTSSNKKARSSTASK